MKDARKIIIKNNKLKKKIERLKNKLYHEPMSGEGFMLCQNKLKEAEKELSDNVPEHREAVKAYLCP